MRQVGNMKLYDFDEILDEMVGPAGTPERDEFDRKVDESVHAWHMGEAIKNERIRQNLTQEELGQRVGVKKSQISRLPHAEPRVQGPGRDHRHPRPRRRRKSSPVVK